MGMFYYIGILTSRNGRFLGEGLKLRRIRKVVIKREFREELGIDIHVDRMAFVIENFFEHGGRDFHEIGFYYAITSKGNPSSYNEASFHGIEGERLIFKWTPIKELNEVALYPECLRDALKDMPLFIQHFVVK